MSLGDDLVPEEHLLPALTPLFDNLNPTDRLSLVVNWVRGGMKMLMTRSGEADSVWSERAVTVVVAPAMVCACRVSTVIHHPDSAG